MHVRTPNSTFATARHPSRSGFVLAAALSLALLAGGCDDGGGGDVPFGAQPDDDGPASGDPGVPGVSAPGGGSGVNGELSGKVLFTLVRPSASLTSADFPPNTVLELDVRTGRYSAVPGNASLEANGLLRRDPTLRLTHDRSASPRLIGTATDCSRSLEEATCVLSMNRNATIESVFIVPHRFAGMAKRSRDGRFVATMTTGEGLELYDMSGRRVSVNSSVSYYGAGTGSPYDWTADGRIVFHYQQGPLPSGPVVLARTLPYSTDIDTFITLPDRYEGDVRSMNVSPSGDRVVLGIDGEERTNDTYLYRRPAVLDLQSLAVYEPLAVEPGDTMNAQDLGWSPDGRWLMFRRVWRTDPIPNIGALPVSPVYAVRADGGRYALPTEPAGSTDKIRMLVMRPMDGSAGPLDPAHQNFTPSLWRD